MTAVMRVLVALLCGWLAGFVMKRGFQTRWVSPDPGVVAVIPVAAVGAAGLIVTQRTIAAAPA